MELPISNLTSSISVENLVDTLVEDELILVNWYQLCIKLESPTERRVRWRLDQQRGVSFYEVFTEMLTEWVLRNNENTSVTHLCDIFEEMRCIELKENLESRFGGSKINLQEVSTSKALKREPIISYGVTTPVKNFVGRVQELQKLNYLFQTKPNLVLICGLGGIGKTELCRKFISDVTNLPNSKGFKTHVFPAPCKEIPDIICLRGDSETSLSESIISLAGSLNTPSSVYENLDSPSELFHFIVKNRLDRSCTLSLVLVIDNVDAKNEEAEKVICKMTRHDRVFIIVTSRNKMILGSAGSTIVLDVLSDYQAERILRMSIQNLSHGDATLLYKLVENYPLALQQTVAYIKQQQNDVLHGTYNVSNYVEEFEQKKREMLDQKLNKFEHDYAMTTLVTWDVTLEKMTQDAVKILEILAHLEAEGVNVAFLQDICLEMGMEADNFNKSLNLVAKYSLAKAVKFVISTHRLVQQVMKQKIVDKFYSKKLFNIILKVCIMRYYKCKTLGSNETKHFSNVSKQAYGLEINITEHLAKTNLNSPVKSNPMDCLVGMKIEISEALLKKCKSSETLEICGEILTGNYCPALHEKTCKILYSMFRIVLNKEKHASECNKIKNKISLVLKLYKVGESKLATVLSKTILNDWKLNPPLETHDLKRIKRQTSLCIGMTRAQIYSDFANFRNNQLLYRLEDLERMFPTYKRVLAQFDKLSTKVCQVVAEDNPVDENLTQVLKTFEEVVNIGLPQCKKSYHVLHFISHAYHTLDNYGEAGKLFEKVLEIRHIQMYEEFSYVNFQKKWVTNTLEKLGEVERDVDWFNECLISTERDLMSARRIEKYDSNFKLIKGDNLD